MNHATDVIAVGGDGTVNLVVNSLMGGHCRFGIIQREQETITIVQLMVTKQIGCPMYTISTKAVDVGAVTDDTLSIFLVSVLMGML